MYIGTGTYQLYNVGMWERLHDPGLCSEVVVDGHSYAFSLIMWHSFLSSYFEDLSTPSQQAQKQKQANKQRPHRQQQQHTHTHTDMNVTDSGVPHHGQQKGWGSVNLWGYVQPNSNLKNKINNAYVCMCVEGLGEEKGQNQIYTLLSLKFLYLQTKSYQKTKFVTLTATSWPLYAPR